MSQADTVLESSKTGQEMGNRDDNDLTSDTTWLNTVQGSSKWESMDTDFVSSRRTHPTRPMTTITTTATRQPTTQEETKCTTQMKVAPTTTTDHGTLQFNLRISEQPTTTTATRVFPDAL